MDVEILYPIHTSSMYWLLVAPHSEIASNHQTTIVALLNLVSLTFKNIMIPAIDLCESLFLVFFPLCT